MEVIKRSGEVVEFNPDKIYQAILKAAQVVYVLLNTIFLIACNVIWNGAAMVIISPCICILSKFAKPLS